MGWESWITIGFLVLGVGYLLFSRPKRGHLKSGSQTQTGAQAAGGYPYPQAEPPKSYKTIPLIEVYEPTPEMSAPEVLGALFMGGMRALGSAVFNRGRVAVVQATDTSNHATSHTSPVQAAQTGGAAADLSLPAIVPAEPMQALGQAAKQVAWEDDLAEVAVSPRRAPMQPVQASKPGNGILDMLRLGSQTLIPLGKDAAANTAAALEVLPAMAPPPPDTGDPLLIPIFYDGEGYITYRVGHDGDIGVFGLKGAGKGNFLRYFALRCAAAGPDRAVVSIFDAKGGVDYWWSDEIEHVECYYPSKGADAARRSIATGLQGYETVMHERYSLLRRARVENVNEYNELIAAGEIEGTPLPYIVMIVDEVADFDAKDQGTVDTLVRMARAAGFVILIATQYPTTDALSSQAANNLNNRIVFRTGNSQVTRVYLGKTKAEGWVYEPAVIPLTRAGLCIWRQLGMEERIGLVPYLSRQYRDHLIDHAKLIGLAWRQLVQGRQQQRQTEEQASNPSNLHASNHTSNHATAPAEPLEQLVQASNHATLSPDDQAWEDARASKLAPYLTNEHLRDAMGIVELEPDIAFKELARKLYEGNYTGDYFYSARIIKARAVYLLGKRKGGSMGAAVLAA